MYFPKDGRDSIDDPGVGIMSHKNNRIPGCWARLLSWASQSPTSLQELFYSRGSSIV